MSRRLTPASWRRLAALLVGLALLYAAFEYGRSLAGYSALSSLLQRQALAGRVATLTRERDQLQRRLAAGAVTRQVDVEAQSEAQAMMGELQAELARQQQELDFYRGLVAEKFGSGTVKVQELSVRPEPRGRFTILVTLVQTAARDVTATGSLTLTVRGSAGGALRQLGLAEISASGEDRVNFTLRYFKTLRIPVALPAGFKPATVELEFRSNRSGPDPVRESFPWSGALVSASEAVLTPEAASE